MTYAVSATEGTGTITVTSTGFNGVLEATRTVTVTKLPVVTPKGSLVVARPSTSYTQNFSVQNPSTAFSATLNLSALCSSTVTCTPPSSPVTLTPGGSTTVPVSYTTGPTGPSGNVMLKASWSTASGFADSGSIAVAFRFLSVSTAANNNANQDMSACAASCFAVAYQQSTVPYVSGNQPRSVTLVYHGDRVAVRPFIYADVSVLPNGPTLQQYWLQAKVNWGGGWTDVTFLNGTPGEQVLHFSPDTTRQVRLAGQFDASAHPTGMYPLQIIVTAQYATYTDQYVDSSQKVLIVNERASPVARGWTIAGLQRLYVQADSSVLLTEGDGSARYFWHCGPTCLSGPSGSFSRLTVSGSGVSTVYTRAYPDSSKAFFNYLGLETMAVSPIADTVVLQYDTFGRVRSFSDPVRTFHNVCFDCGAPPYIHRTTRLVYGAYGIDSIVEPGNDSLGNGSGRVTLFTIASDSTLHAITDPDGMSTTFGYDAARRLSTIVDRRGDTTRYVYRADSSWKLAAIVLPRVPIDNGGGGTTLQTPTIQYAPWQTVGVPRTATASTPYTPVPTASVADTITDPQGHAVVSTVDYWGQPLRITEPYGRTTTITRSGMLAVKVVHPAGGVDTAAYTSDGLLRYDQLAGQNAISISYGAFARPTAISRTGQPTQTFIYGHDGRDSLMTIAGSTMHFYSDDMGRDTMVVDPLGHTTKYHYDPAFGNLDSTLAPGNRWTRTVFDHVGRDSLHLANGQPADTTSYSLVNRVTRVAVAGLGAVTYQYDPVFLTRMQDPKGNVYRVTLDALGRIARRYDPADTLSRFVSYRYNLDGLVTSWTDRRGHRTDFAYDSVHRELSKTGSFVVPDSFSYNPTGTITVGWNGASRDSIFTNAIGWTDSVVTWLEPANQRFRRYYHHTGVMQLDSVGLQTTSGITFANRHYYWNPSTGLLDSLGAATKRATITHNADFLDSTITWPGSVVETIDHTTRHEVLSTAFSVPVVNGTMSRTYGYADSLGHITQVERPWFPDGQVRRFYYTSAGQLRWFSIDSVTQTNGCAPPTGNQFRDDGGVCQSFAYLLSKYLMTFTYDSSGNLTTQRDELHLTSTLGSYGAGDRLQTWGGATYAVDADGNDSTRTVADTTTTFQWTADGRLNAVTRGNITVFYVYNAFGQLVQRYRSTDGVTVKLERQFLWDNGQLMAELDSTASRRIAEYVYWPEVDHPFALVTGSQAIDTTRYFAQDELGNVIGVFSAGGATQQLSYLPFGGLDSTYSVLGTLADTNRLRWKGLLWEGGPTNLYYVRNRWYDPAAGRFMSEDPIGLAGGINPYIFAGNDPIDGFDASGLDGMCPDGTVLLRQMTDADGNTWIACGRGAGDSNPIIIEVLAPVVATPQGGGGTSGVENSGSPAGDFETPTIDIGPIPPHWSGTIFGQRIYTGARGASVKMGIDPGTGHRMIGLEGALNVKTPGILPDAVVIEALADIDAQTLGARGFLQWPNFVWFQYTQVGDIYTVDLGTIPGVYLVGWSNAPGTGGCPSVNSFCNK